MDGIGLVLSGGGGKGAYQIGVWKYLREIGLDKEICAVSGTSVGALNAALFVGGTYEKAEDLWMSISPEKILEFDLKHIMGIIEKTTIVPVSTALKLVPFIIELLKEGCFSRTALSELIDRGVDYQRLQNNGIPCFVTCVKLPSIVSPFMAVDYFKLNNLSSDKITKSLLASSAIPIIFPVEHIDKRPYVDGGTPPVGKNIPIGPMYDLGVRTIIVVSLNPKSKVHKRKHSHCRIIEINPSKDLGNFKTGTLDFSPEGAARRIALGYNDAKRIMKSEIRKKAIDLKSLKSDKSKIYVNPIYARSIFYDSLDRRDEVF